MNPLASKHAIQSALAGFASQPLASAATALFEALGYRSQKRLTLSPNTPANFLATFAQGRPFNAQLALTDDWQSVDFLFQLTDEEVRAAADGNQQFLFDSKGQFNGAAMESYLFFAIALKQPHYTRTALAGITRAVNRLFPMPVLLLFRHGDTLTLAVINRRLHKRDESRDVLEKVTLIKDVACADPIRAHLEILNDFALANLAADYGVANFVALHEAWQKRLGSYALSDGFYREIADWYFWAHHQVEEGKIRLPLHCDTEQEKSLFLIRLLTRVIFCWFLVEKRLIPADLFREHRLRQILKDFAPSRDPARPDTAPTFYRAILQNLFFGTLNMPPEHRAFRQKRKPGERYDPNYGITNLWRYESYFRDPAEWEQLAARIPFLNGGLFDCLDDKPGGGKPPTILDGFSDHEDEARYGCHLPNDLFFGPERTVDLSRDYGEETKKTARSKRAKVRGLIEILSRYKFTIEENTPLEEEIALDPELLGKVFENLLASYNEDTRTTARKALGAFYTPREIVSYMVDEALKSYLKTSVEQTFLSAQSITKTRRNLPHWKKDAAIYWITFRMADSLPQDKLRAWREERDIWLSHHPEPWSESDWEEYNERFGERLEAWLDAGMGSRALARPDVREAVKNCLLKFDGERLHIHAAVIMPNHVHALIEPFAGQDLSKLLQGIKGASAREANKLLGQTGNTFWLDESYDHIVRSQNQYEHFLRYIAENPVKAGLRPDEFWLREGGADIPVCASPQQGQTRMSATTLSRILNDLFSNKATLADIPPDTRDALIAAIGRVKILDPACGSGAFPMGALHRLVDLLQKLDPNNESWKRDRLAEARRYRQLLESQGGADIPVCASSPKGQTGMSAPLSELAACDARIADIEKSFDTRYHALDFARKLYLIENAIYGVDIQPIATQIAKLRFFIALVVDQKVDPAAPNLGVRPLPNLETRLVAADTLIPVEKTESDLFSGELDRLRAELAAIRHEHFNARSPAAKRKWRDADAAKRAELARALEQSHALSKDAARQLAAWDPYDQNTSAPFFDPEWMFGLPVGKIRLQGKAPATLLGNLALINEAGGQTELTPTTPQEYDSGFDIVIGNPPYVRMEQIKHLKPLFTRIYECFSGRADLYVYFFERSISLLRQGGALSFITSDTFFNRDFGEKLRGFLTTKTSMEILVDFGETGVFTAFTEPCIILVRRGGEPNPKVRVLKWDEAQAVLDVRAKIEAKLFTLPQSHFGTDPWRIESPRVNELIARLKRSGQTVGSLTNHRILYGVKTGLNEAFVVDAATRDALIREDKNSAELIKPFLRGRDIGRWVIQPTSAWLIYIPKGTDISRYKAIERHLKPFKKALESRATKQEWYELQQAQFAYYDAFCGPKIVFQDIARSYGMAWDDAGHFLANTCYFIPGDFKWLLGMLMSAPMRFYVHKVLGADEGGFIRLFSGQVDAFPIPHSNEQQNAALTVLVEALLWLNRHFAEHPEVQTPRDPLMVAYWERVLNGLVYELYFPEEVHGAGLRLFDLVAQAALPEVTTLPEAARLKTLRAKFEELHDPTHPLRQALEKLATLDTIRIIEGRT